MFDKDIINRLQERQDTQRSKTFSNLFPGQNVTAQHPTTAKWEPGTLIQRVEKIARSYYRSPQQTGTFA